MKTTTTNTGKLQNFVRKVREESVEAILKSLKTSLQSIETFSLSQWELSVLG